MHKQNFRMAELERLSGLPRTTLHYYRRIGILPPPVKSAANAGHYGQEHLERLALIRRLRSPEFGKLPMRRVRRIIDRVKKGVSPEVAVALDQAVAAGAAGRAEEALSLPQLEERSGVPADTLREMVRIGILIPDPFDRGDGFDDVDVRVARTVHATLLASGRSLSDVAPVAALLASVVDHEMSLRNRAVEGMPPEANARVTLELQKAANLLHAYLLSRGLERAIARHEGKKRRGSEQAIA